ncbi:hypothetical protein PVA17_21615 [Lysinibacillus sp. CNPSo 3705]|uniref:hypothetical protein n=1 Tax=Lysinibacillus sp. CNPSo 3705 TaxID=3028148 RepID=UPI002363DC7A|nr:hypothetical protein [Lysinibacillus sp. CNPSo 3705]MDD1505322.1 hypothetical protein [Lysinibacillus sp. CNPSo 3705]
MKLLNALPLKPPPGNFDENHMVVADEQTFDGVLDNLFAVGAKATEKIFTWGINAITIMFLCAVIMMIMAIIFKNGQWQKFAQTLMLWTFLGMLSLRAVPMIILSFRSEGDVDDAFSTVLLAISQMTIFIGLIALMLSLLFRLAHKLIAHPEYHRWSKNTLNVSLMMILFALIGPFIFGIM